MIAAFEYFAPHHEELRKRLIRSILAIVIATVVAYLFIDQIVAFCMQPLFSAYPALQKLVYTKLTEAFITYLKLALLVGIIASSPVLVYQVWMFVAPGLMDNERKLARQVVFWSTFLFAGGANFAFFIALPHILHFFMGYAGPNLEPLAAAGTGTPAPDRHPLLGGSGILHLGVIGATERTTHGLSSLLLIYQASG